MGRSDRRRASQVRRVTAGTSADLTPGRPSLLVVATVAGTIGAFLTPYAAHFRSLGWRVDAAAAQATGDPRVLAGFDNAYDLPLSRSVRDLRGLARTSRALRDILATAPDIVHVHTPIASFLTRYRIRRRPSPRRPAVVYTAHGFHFHAGGAGLANAAFLAAERIAGRWTDRLIVINDEDEHAARRYRIVPDGQLVRMPGIGLDTGYYAPEAVPVEAPAQTRRQLGIGADAPVFAIIGELSSRKRQADAIAALGVLRHPDAHLVLAGGGQQGPALENQARAIGVDDRVHFLGLLADVRPVIRAATAVLLTSAREGLPRSVMEALSLESPVIASTARGNRELVGDDRGLVFQTGDIGGLALAMRWMIDHPDERRQMGVRGRAQMVERYDLPILIRLHEELYGRLLTERRTP